MNNKISSNIGLNLFSYIFFAISGILLNIIVGIYYDAATLGVFNTVYAMYILLSQVCVFGQNFTILSFVSNDFDKKIRKEYLINSLFLTVSVSLMACLLLYFMAPLFGIIFNSIKVATGIKIVVIALPAFAINKILTGYLNGTKNLKAFAFFRTLRMVLIALLCTSFVY